MIVSDKYKYLFIQHPTTASTSIALELCLKYDGKPILWKHANYRDFLTIATEEQKKYFVFCWKQVLFISVCSQLYFFLSYIFLAISLYANNN